MIELKWYQFADAEVQSAKDATEVVSIPAGVHLVVFDDVVSRAGNTAECEIGFGGPNGSKARILRATLIKLCAGGHAVLAGDAT